MDPDHFGRIADPHVRNLIAWAEGAFRAWALGGNAEVPVWLAAYGRLLHLAWGAGPPRPVEPTRTRLASPFGDPPPGRRPDGDARPRSPARPLSTC
ncbi:MAG: hypothetical protein FJZ90_06805 [Chloroflexi bacterium]|nr:hypothetical protein [Chloroflexota bacterium]